ncbi:unnamed protein product [Amoebophrya sp. A120]|nr:unnamed protein product [Amoebophrya sp. A120]|eukprot:GSA120T00023813001.1
MSATTQKMPSLLRYFVHLAVRSLLYHMLRLVRKVAAATAATICLHHDWRTARRGFSLFNWPLGPALLFVGRYRLAVASPNTGQDHDVESGAEATLLDEDVLGATTTDDGDNLQELDIVTRSLADASETDDQSSPGTTAGIIAQRPSLQATKWFLAEFPEHMQSIRNIPLPCEYFGHMYSFEVSFAQFLRDNSEQFVVSDPLQADFILLPHCITMVYHALRYQLGFNTRRKTWEALDLSQREYLIPIINWAKEQEWYNTFDAVRNTTNGLKFVIPFAMDKGRVDYPIASKASAEWHAVTTVGDKNWLRSEAGQKLLFLKAAAASTTSSRRRVDEDSFPGVELASLSADEQVDTVASSQTIEHPELRKVVETETTEVERGNINVDDSDPLEEAIKTSTQTVEKLQQKHDEKSEDYWNTNEWIDPVFHYHEEKKILRFLLQERKRRRETKGVAVHQDHVEPQQLPFDPCFNQTSVSKRPFLYYEQDVVVPVPTAFYFTEEAKATENRSRLLFLAASVNSCTRRLVKDVAKVLFEQDSDVLVLDKTVERHVWQNYMYETKYCLVPDGFSSVSARLYEVILHGCVPVLVTDAFHGAFENSLPWKDFAVFINRVDLPFLPKLLREEISEEEYLEKHRIITKIHPYLHEETGFFWQALFKELQLKKRTVVKKRTMSTRIFTSRNKYSALETVVDQDEDHVVETAHGPPLEEKQTEFFN